MTAPFDPTPPPPQTRSLRLPLAQPRVTYALLIINVVVWLAMMAAGGSTNTQVLIQFGAKVNPLIVEGQVWRLFTAMFLHIGLMHLLFNSYALFIFGMEVERVYGSARFLTIYLLAGLFGSLASFALVPNLSAGASGAIFGLLGAMVAYFRRHRQTLGEWGNQRLINLLGIAGFNLVLGFTVPGIDNMAHLGGLLAGLALGWLLVPQYRVEVGVEGQPYVADQTSLLTRWWVVLLAVALWVAGVMGTMAVQQGSAPNLIQQGQSALEDGDLAAAEALFRRAAAEDPDSAQAFFYLGVVLSSQEQMAQAARAYQDALDLAPDLAAAHWNLALSYARLGRPKDAIAEFEAFIALQPDSPDADQARAFIAELQDSAP